MPTLDPLSRLTAIVDLSRFKSLALFAAVAFLRPAPGGITPQEATAQFKASAAAAVKTLKGELQGAKTAFLEDVQAYETSIDLGVSVETATSTLFEGCKSLQAEVNSAADQAMTSIVDAAVAALLSLSNGAPLEGAFPKDFYSGTGGAFDKARRDVRSNVEKLYKSLANRLKKTVNLLGKSAAVLTIELRPPLFLEEWYFAETSPSTFTIRFGLDIILAVNRSGLAEDGRVWLGGAAYSGVDQVTVLVVGAIDESDSATVAPDLDRWNVTLTDNGSLFRKGNYMATVLADGAGGVGATTFSFR